MNGLRRFLYAWARFLGDVNAIARGPRAMGKRYGRKMMGRAYGRASNKVIK